MYLLDAAQINEGESGAQGMHMCRVSAAAAEQCLLRIARHRCAYGTVQLSNPEAKARSTFLSMQGSAAAAAHVDAQLFQPLN